MPAKPDKLMGILGNVVKECSSCPLSSNKACRSAKLFKVCKKISQAHTAIKELQKREVMSEEEIEKIFKDWNSSISGGNIPYIQPCQHEFVEEPQSMPNTNTLTAKRYRCKKCLLVTEVL